MLALVACLIISMTAVSIPAQAATTNPLTPTQETAAKPILRKAFPGITDAQITTLVRDLDFVQTASQVVSVEYEPTSVNPTMSLRSIATSFGSYTTMPCLKGTSSVKVRGIFGTLFSFTTTLSWCYDNNRVYYQTHSLKPDVTTYGATFGWAYEGQWQPLNKHYYSYNGHYLGGYIVQAFPQFNRCITKLGCIDQKFGDVAFMGHYNGTYTLWHTMD